MDMSEALLDTMEAQRPTDVSHDTELPTELFSNFRLSDLDDIPIEPVLMIPEIFSAVIGANNECLERFKRSGTPIECLTTDQGNSILHLSASQGHCELVSRILLDFPSLFWKPNLKKQIPIHVAVHAGCLDVVLRFIVFLTNVSTRMSEEDKERWNPYVRKDTNGDTALHLALKGGHMEIAYFLLIHNQQASFLANEDRISPLYLAVEVGNYLHVRLMLNTTGNDGLEGRESNLRPQFEGRQYLVHAALKSKNTDILDVILEEYPSLEKERDEDGMTCLSFGASIGFDDGVSKLLRRSTNSVYECNDDGSFPIHIAVEKQHMGVVGKLLAWCPDSKHLLNKQGQNILHIASKSGITAYELSRYLSRIGWIDQLIEKQDLDGNTPLHLATINWRPRTLLILLYYSFKEKSMYIRNNKGLTALAAAESNLHPNYIFIERVTLMVLLVFYSLISRGSLWERLITNKITKQSDPPAGDQIKEYVNTLLLVAALVATVTFAAGFTIPGGFNSSAPYLGMATLANDSKLILFMVFDTMAMQSSVLTIATLFWAQFGDPALVQKSLNVALPLLFYGLNFMSAAFFFGVLVVFAHVKVLAIFLSITFILFYYLICFVLFPHILLQMPGCSTLYGLYFLILVLIVDDDAYLPACAAKISDKDPVEKEERT